MRQLTYVRANVLEWWDVPEPTIQDDRQAIVRPLAVSRCDLDLAIANGKAGFEGPFAIGHETSGVVVEVGDDVKEVKPGDFVIVPFQISCGECPNCRRGLPYACKTVPYRSSYGLKPACGVEYGGALSDAMLVPFADHMLIKQPPGHDLSQTASLADSATDAFSVVAPVLQERPGAEVLVVGGGLGQSLGAMIVHAALSLGSSRVVYVDSSKEALAKCKSLGAEVIEAHDFAKMNPPGAFPLTIDAACSTASLSLALRSVEPAGVCQRMYGDFTETTAVPLRHMYGMGVTLKIGRVNVRARLPECVEHLKTGHYHPEAVLTHRVSFDDAHEAIKDPTMKVLFLRDGTQ
ncbi:MULTISPECIES: alcohol dehydrogenase catalytic domain-containing protein [unclassified Bradyrhizobium]|uniref:zinc-dependent alcohol dehydrogenase n=1 Tax=unclassified Bradyrhizobium TaxID=2631580 RepID=UPI0024786983|nr:MULTISPECIES: alcohol dehydrogenase catalytic domain-containing protein [unclassified Bradyrhizobium]WGS19890.1 alcohol dehydrogenase catalytic domain-containing protein [Bradyrhizobium sp. ISRA463]WGS26744.1 alcohol dehydrogenase catalytic domain-containing protein [Bradyrhizobium sp. ISRA464]